MRDCPMAEDEINDLKLLRELQLMCKKAEKWDSCVSFEEIWQVCSNQICNLKKNVGERIIEEYEDNK